MTARPCGWDYVPASGCDLSQRVVVANRAKADVYLSIHHNAGSTAAPAAASWPMWPPKYQKQSEVVRDAVYHILWRPPASGATGRSRWRSRACMCSTTPPCPQR